MINKHTIQEKLRKLKRSIVATPSNREALEAFAKANHGSSDMILMQMAIQYGYTIALEELLEDDDLEDEPPEPF